MSVAPTALAAIDSLLAEPGRRAGIAFGFGAPSDCGSFVRGELWSVPGFTLVRDLPFLVVVPAFLLWLSTRRRAVGWAAAGVLGAVCAAEPLLFGYDLLRHGTACSRVWLGQFGGQRIAEWAYGLVPAALILAATYRPGPRAYRSAGAAVLAVVLLFGTAADQERTRIVATGEKECRNARLPDLPRGEAAVREVARMTWDERELAYLCVSRGITRYGLAPVLQGPPFQEPPIADGQLLREGRLACRGEGKVWQSSRGHRILSAITYLCPETVAARDREERRRTAVLKAEYDRDEARATAHCRRGLPRGPRPVRQATLVFSGGESSSYQVGAGAPFDAAHADGLVAAAGRGATILTGTEGWLCLTVRAYRKAPPLDLKGWERAAEVGFDSADGATRISSMSDPARLPVVTAAGPGPYRLRVYVRGRNAGETLTSEAPAERHLLAVFPGRSKEPKVYKNKER
ncbi:hypothetical protein [Spirillospora sp. NPDC029432]|uniref:hypothetical protein n=1 Tax=Spirillospora sp. NPDC029432 TaxID=3154599 RepID=UPI00345354AD